MKYIAILLFFFCSTIYADSDVTNSNNTNTSTQSNEITHNDTYDDHSSNTDSSSTVDSSTDNSVGSHITTDSNNQANQSYQTITNTNTEGDLEKSKNTNSFNENVGNTTASNVSQTTTGGTGTGYANSTSGSTVRTGSVTTGGTYISNNQRYTTATQAPNLTMLVGMISHNANMCMYQAGGSASGSNGMAAGGFSLLLGFDSDNCEMWQRANFLISMNQYVGACILLSKFDKENRDGLFADTINEIGGCRIFIPLVIRQPVSVNVVPNSYWKKAEKKLDAQLNELHKHNMVK